MVSWSQSGLSGTDLKYFINILIFNSLKFEQIPVQQCPLLMAIPMIWNHLIGLSSALEKGMTSKIMHLKGPVELLLIFVVMNDLSS